MPEKIISIAQQVEQLRAEKRETVKTFDEVALLISYVNIHGVGEQQPESTGDPQVLKVSPEAFWELFQ